MALSKSKGGAELSMNINQGCFSLADRVKKGGGRAGRREESKLENAYEFS